MHWLPWDRQGNKKEEEGGESWGRTWKWPMTGVSMGYESLSTKGSNYHQQLYLDFPVLS